MRRRTPTPATAFGRAVRPAAAPAPVRRLPDLVQVQRLPPGWNDVRVHVPKRYGTCAEADCPGYKTTAAGVQVACTERHRVWTGQPPTYFVNGVVVPEDQFRQAVGEGVHTMNHIITRGL